jgi:hypothetical protein
MSVRSVGVDAPVPVPVADTDAAVPAAAAEAKAVPGSQTTRDGVDAAKQAQSSVFGEQRMPEADGPLPGDAVGLADVLADLSLALGADPNFATLAGPVQERMLTGLKDSPGLAETFKRLANSPNFRKLPVEVQAKVVELLSKLDKTEAQAVENLVRSPAFAALPEKEQLKMLQNLSTSPEAREQLQHAGDGPQTGMNNPLGALDAANLLQIANLFEMPLPAELPVGQAELPVDADRGGQTVVAGATRSPYLEIKRIINGLRAAVPLTPAAVHGVIGIHLSPVTAGATTSFLARPTKGPFDQLELRPLEKPGSWLVLLQVRGSLDVRYDEFRDDLIPDAIEPQLDPLAPPEGEMTFHLADVQPRQELAFTFEAAIARLRRISLRR